MSHIDENNISINLIKNLSYIFFMKKWNDQGYSDLYDFLINQEALRWYFPHYIYCCLKEGNVNHAFDILKKNMDLSLDNNLPKGIDIDSVENILCQNKLNIDSSIYTDFKCIFNDYRRLQKDLEYKKDIHNYRSLETFIQKIKYVKIHDNPTIDDINDFFSKTNYTLALHFDFNAYRNKDTIYLEPFDSDMYSIKQKDNIYDILVIDSYDENIELYINYKKFIKNKDQPRYIYINVFNTFFTDIQLKIKTNNFTLSGICVQNKYKIKLLQKYFLNNHDMLFKGGFIELSDYE